MATLFSRIIKGEIPCYKIAEDDRYFAFLDINPLKAGHTLVVPKQETDYIFDLDNEMLAGLIVFSKKVAVAIKKAFPCNRIGVAVLGLEIPHVHIHLVPMDSMEDVNFRNPKLKFTPEEFKQIAEKIRKEIK
ncbi:MAG: histidine triad protein [Bacteroidetes bacterium]|jgi:histidine triad (HIT) family protein|nr:histidine triad protein [Bacteroidota bacterium]